MTSHSDSDNLLPDGATADDMRIVDELCDNFEQAWLDGERTNLGEYLERAPQHCRAYLLTELVAIELRYRQDGADQKSTFELIRSENPEVAELLISRWANLTDSASRDSASRESDSRDWDSTSTVRRDQPPSQSDVVRVSSRGSHGLHIRCPHCQGPVELLADTPCEEISCQTCGSTFSLVDRSEYTQSAPTLKSLGRFELISRLGVGGFGTVWKARDTELDRVVAVKIPRRGNLGPEQIDHFFREARAAAQLRHPNIVSVYEIGREDDTVFIISDFVCGITLTDWLTGPTPSFREIAELGRTIAEALQHAHAQGVIHRDLKPSNVLIDDLGQPHIMDFGLAKRQTGEVTMTFDGQILGTAAYMSPEQAGGKSHWTDARADLYSLGVMLFQMATGELPYRGNHEMHLYRKQTEDAPDPTRLNRHLPKDLATICLKCLERDPNKRYTTAAEVANELNRFLQGEPILARPISRVERAWRWAKCKPALASATALTLFIAVAGPIVATTLWLQAQELRQNDQEQINTIAQEQSQRAELEGEKAALEQQIDNLLGRTGGLQQHKDGWQRMLVQQIVDAQYAAQATTLTPQGASNLEQAKFHQAVGYLCVDARRPQLAFEHLLLARDALERELQSRPGEPMLLVALAESLKLISKHADEESVIEQTRQSLKTLQPQLARLQPKELAAKFHVLSARWQGLDQYELDDQIENLSLNLLTNSTNLLQDWPTSPGAVYEAACRLTLRSPLLAESEQE